MKCMKNKMFSGSNTNSDGFGSQYVTFVGGLQSAGGASTEATGVANATGPGGIDWAQLAQQWIQMRDTAAPNIAIAMDQPDFSMPLAPPPPIISAMPAYQPQKPKHHGFVEHGEADMEMDDDNDGERRATARGSSPPPPAPHVTQSQWFAGERSDEMPNRNQSNSQWHMWPPRVDVPPPTSAVNGLPTEPNINNPTAHIPSLLKLNVSNPNDPNNHQASSDNMASSSSSGVDASKRKLLPAWIREGLEKMEREKQRQLERQQPSIKDSTVSNYESSNEPPFITKITPVNLLHKINVASESESGNDDDDNDDDDDDDEDEDQHLHVAHVNTKKTPRGGSSDVEKNFATIKRSDNKTVSPRNSVIGKSYEQKLADLMSVVRRTLTELLLETTNEEIASVAQDALKAQRAKASSAQVIRKSALSSITGKLGLAAYADSSSDEESSNSPSDDEDDIQSNKKADIDSEEELKNTIRNKRRAFAKTIEEIEKRTALAEQREEQKLKYHRQLEREQAEKAQRNHRKYAESQGRQAVASTSKSSGGSNSKGYERDFGETTTSTTDTKLQQYNGKRLNRKERQTRFSDNKDSKNATLNATPSFLNHLQQVTNIAGDGSNANGTSKNNSNSKKLLPLSKMTTSLLQTSDSTSHLAPGAASITGTANSGMMNILNAAHAALEKATQKTKSSAKKKRRRRSSSASSNGGSSTNNSSSSSTTNSSSDSDDKTCSSTSRNSKQSHRSSASRPRYEQDHRYRDRRRHDKYKSSRRGDSYKHRERGYSPDRHAGRDSSRSRSRRRHRKHYSSDSDGDYQRDSKRRHVDEKRRKHSRSSSSFSSSRCASEQQKQRRKR